MSSGAPIVVTMVWFIYLYTMQWSPLSVQVVITVMCTHCCIQWCDLFTCIPCSDHHFLFKWLSLPCAPIVVYNGVIDLPVYHAVITNFCLMDYHCHMHRLLITMVWHMYLYTIQWSTLQMPITVMCTHCCITMVWYVMILLLYTIQWWTIHCNINSFLITYLFNSN